MVDWSIITELYSEKVLVTIYPQVVAFYIFINFKMLKDTVPRKHFLSGERGCIRVSATQFLPLVEC